MKVIDLFKIVIIVQLFYAFSIVMISHSVPEDSLNHITSFSDITNQVSLESVSGQVTESLESQTNIPIIEMGALVFYSGNILLDLILNFAFAIPQMVGLLVQGILQILSIDSYLFAYVELFASVAILSMYLIGIIQLVTSLRSGRLT